MGILTKFFICFFILAFFKKKAEDDKNARSKNYNMERWKEGKIDNKEVLQVFFISNFFFGVIYKP